MFMPTIFHENLFDDFFDPFWNDGALERALNREERETFGKRGANMMKTDVKQTTDGSYDVAVDLPGCKKEDVQMELNDGYLTIPAVRSHSNDEKDQEGRYLRRETFSGTCARSFYVGDAVKKEDIHAKFEDGILHVTLSFHLFFSLFCSRYSVFNASMGVMVDSSSSFNSFTMSSSFTVSKMDI